MKTYNEYIAPPENSQVVCIHGLQKIYAGTPEADLLAGKFSKHGVKLDGANLEPTAPTCSARWFRAMELIMRFEGWPGHEITRQLGRIRRDLEDERKSRQGAA